MNGSLSEKKHVRAAGRMFVAALSTVSMALAAPSIARAQSAPREELVVDFDDAVSEAQIAEAAQQVGVAFVPNSVLFAEDRVVRTTVAVDRAEGVLARLRSLPGVRAAEHNVEMHASFTPNDPQLGEQWNMVRVGASQAWDRACGRGITVAVIDTGVACENHGEFTRVMDLAGTRCAPGYDFVNDDEHANDDQGHGTHVAGTIAQTTNNGFGVAGLAYCATILPVKVLNQNGSGSLADVAEGIRWAADHGANVINLSLGGGGRTRMMAEAVAYARSRGTAVIAAAGNNGRYVESPANEPGSFAVSAIGPGDEIAYFSSRGPEVDLAAPGVNVLQQTICDNGRNRCEQFAAWSGTSMATPHVAGVAAMVASLGVTDPDALERVLQHTAQAPEHGGRDRELFGAGVLHAPSALDYVLRATALARGLALAAMLFVLLLRIRAQKGQIANPLTWLPTALFTALGLFFLPWVTSTTVPAVDLAMRPLGDWSLPLLGSSLHRWLPFANAGVVLALVALGFGRRALRAPIGGFALGTAAYLVATLATGFHRGPFGFFLQAGWLVLNALVCVWVARIGLDKRTSESESP